MGQGITLCPLICSVCGRYITHTPITHRQAGCCTCRLAGASLGKSGTGHHSRLMGSLHINEIIDNIGGGKASGHTGFHWPHTHYSALLPPWEGDSGPVPVAVPLPPLLLQVWFTQIACPRPSLLHHNNTQATVSILLHTWSMVNC